MHSVDKFKWVATQNLQGVSILYIYQNQLKLSNCDVFNRDLDSAKLLLIGFPQLMNDFMIF